MRASVAVALVAGTLPVSVGGMSLRLGHLVKPEELNLEPYKQRPG